MMDDIMPGDLIAVSADAWHYTESIVGLLLSDHTMLITFVKNRDDMPKESELTMTIFNFSDLYERTTISRLAAFNGVDDEKAYAV